MAGYSGTPLAKKLGIKEGHRLVLLGAPDGFEATLAPLPEPVQLSRRLSGKADVVLLFVDREAELERRFAAIVEHLDPAGGFWVAWPKKAAAKAARISTDMTEDVVRKVALPRGLVDNKVCAIDEFWSGLRLVVRLENRPAAAGRAPKR
jgi:hypothetical protein